MPLKMRTTMHWETSAYHYRLYADQTIPQDHPKNSIATFEEESGLDVECHEDELYRFRDVIVHDDIIHLSVPTEDQEDRYSCSREYIIEHRYGIVPTVRAYTYSRMGSMKPGVHATHHWAKVKGDWCKVSAKHPAFRLHKHKPTRTEQGCWKFESNDPSALMVDLMRTLKNA